MKPSILESKPITSYGKISSTRKSQDRDS